ncbi:hypothetical protein EVAR_36071_1 [Eumeta japonica]|uniref:Uncharacterized protein n=1 Tax=Eumeta variegata TaxID=151549 RepID=A0A4C1ZFI9_EUMVA|nr:hypothetical protein EVAR_36071_1 [Eumeta japonica]
MQTQRFLDITLDSKFTRSQSVFGRAPRRPFAHNYTFASHNRGQTRQQSIAVATYTIKLFTYTQRETFMSGWQINLAKSSSKNDVTNNYNNKRMVRAAWRGGSRRHANGPNDNEPARQSQEIILMTRGIMYSCRRIGAQRGRSARVASAPGTDDLSAEDRIPYESAASIPDVDKSQSTAEQRRTPVLVG